MALTHAISTITANEDSELQDIDNSSLAVVIVNFANLAATKTANKSISYVGDTITYTISIKNNGNVPADDVIITDQLPNGTSYVAGSITSIVPFTGNPISSIQLTNPIAPGETVAISFIVLITESPNPNPAINTATISYKYTAIPSNPDGVTVTTTVTSNSTAIFQNNYSQEISDLIESIALEEAALANIQNVEGAKIQKFVAMPNVTPEMLLCLNKSVQEMADAMTIFESILIQKLNVVNCQINGRC